MVSLHMTTYRLIACWQRCLLTVALALSALLGVQAQSMPASDTTAIDTPAKHRDRKAVVANTTPDKDSHPVRVVTVAGDTVTFASMDSVTHLQGVEILADSIAPATTTLGDVRVFNPDPERALWLSALCPGLGQIYNRRYWKLPIVVGAFVGLTYGTAWNNRMYQDYSKAYRDVMDDDPDTRSYMDFFPPTVNESDLDVSWLQKTMRNKRDYYRRYKEICIICMVGVYLVNIVDAYVDASLAHFDISPDLSMDVTPAAIDNQHITGGKMPSLGLQCAITF